MNSFVEALHDDFEIHLIINESSLARVQHLSDKIVITTLKDQHYLADILRCKKQFNPDLILLNSAQGRKIRNLCLALIFDPIPIVGVHHNAENIYSSFTQKIISFKIKKYVVLADFIKQYLISKTKQKIESFYPLAYHQKVKVDLDYRLRYIAIPGVLEQDRRDYLGFIGIIKTYEQQLDPRLRFVLLGNSKTHDGLEITASIRSNKLENRFILFDEYVEDEVLLSYVEQSVAVMPLLQPGTRWFEKYFETKISGAYSLAFAYDKVLLMHEVFTGKDEFRTHGIFYNHHNFANVVRQLSKSSDVKKPAKLEFAFQKQRLLDFLNSN